MDKIKGGLKHVSQAVSSIVFPQIAAGAEIIMKKIDDKIILIEKRIIRKLLKLQTKKLKLY